MTTTIGIIGAGHLIKHMMPAMAKTDSRFLVSERGRDIIRLAIEKSELQFLLPANLEESGRRENTPPIGGPAGEH